NTRSNLAIPLRELVPKGQSLLANTRTSVSSLLSVKFVRPRCPFHKICPTMDDIPTVDWPSCTERSRRSSPTNCVRREIEYPERLVLIRVNPFMAPVAEPF